MPDGAILIERRGRYLVKLAENAGEIAMAQQLRGRMFPRDGAENDSDDFDPQFSHLLVIDREAGKLAGTYRIQSPEAARKGLGFYSETEFKIKNFDRIAADTYEVGRSCVAPEYRSGSVISLLWSGLSALQRRCGFRYLIGCASIDSREPETGWGLFTRFRIGGNLSPMIFGRSCPKYHLPSAAGNALPPLPPLIKGYLRLGAQIASEPALDREFGCIDFLIFFDFKEMDPRYSHHFLQSSREAGD